MNDTTFHLVVPCFRESGRIAKFLPDLCREMDAAGNCRVLIVDDGSAGDEPQRMRDIVEDLRPTHACLRPPMLLPRNLGKGGAVYAGWGEHENAEWLGFVDADGSVSAYEVARLLRLARERGTAGGSIFASRVKMLGKTVERHLHRHLMGRVFATLVSELLSIPVYDSQCGFKLVPARAFETIAPVLRKGGYAFDVELLAALLDSRCPVVEEPVDWKEIEHGRMQLPRDAWRMLKDVFSIRRQRSSAAWLQHMADLEQPDPTRAIA